jgi:hypothetical protein
MADLDIKLNSLTKLFRELNIGQRHGTGWAVINNEGGGVYWIVGGLNGNYMLAGGSGTGPTNTYGGGGIAGGNGGQLANTLYNAFSWKTVSDEDAKFLLERMGIDPISLYLEGIFLPGISLIFILGYGMLIGGLLAALALAPIFILVFLCLAIITYVYWKAVLDPQGEYIIA